MYGLTLRVSKASLRSKKTVDIKQSSKVIKNPNENREESQVQGNSSAGADLGCMGVLGVATPPLAPKHLKTFVTCLSKQ